MHFYLAHRQLPTAKFPQHQLRADHILPPLVESLAVRLQHFTDEVTTIHAELGQILAQGVIDFLLGYRDTVLSSEMFDDAPVDQSLDIFLPITSDEEFAEFLAR